MQNLQVEIRKFIVLVDHYYFTSYKAVKECFFISPYNFHKKYSNLYGSSN